MTEWWYFEIPTLISGMYGDPNQLAASVILSNFALVTRKIPTGISLTTTKDVNKAIVYNKVSVGLQRANASIILVLIITVFNAIAYFLLQNIMPKLYSRQSEVLLITQNTWVWFVLLNISVALRRVIQGVVRGLRRQNCELYVTLFSCYIVGLPFMVYFGYIQK